ncbi:hypothetical protein [Paenibacillus segetis]|uniref:Uncharacterized protein n=1 Tax=Paenibacillus segetis TaxID=1325360 RepID=A0ABQ1Y948_9BACL|nr:hypothetical protein [Paenibacillus segetis]GGH16977.1 hypothetical protein GCM10008013_12110 [Paenibacillus segetis]
MIRIGVFNGSDRDLKLEPMIIKASGTEPSPEVIAYYASQPKEVEKRTDDEKKS